MDARIADISSMENARPWSGRPQSDDTTGCSDRNPDWLNELERVLEGQDAAVTEKRGASPKEHTVTINNNANSQLLEGSKWRGKWRAVTRNRERQGRPWTRKGEPIGPTAWLLLTRKPRTLHSGTPSLTSRARGATPTLVTESKTGNGSTGRLRARTLQGH